MKGHVLVVRADNAGDVLLAGPAVRAVAAGASRVTLLAGPAGAGAAALLPGVDAVVVERLAWIDPEPEPVTAAALSAMAARLASVGASTALVLTSFHQSALPTALLLRLAGVDRVVAASEDYPGTLLDVAVRDHLEPDAHEVVRNLAVAEAAGFSLPEGDPRTLAVSLPPGTALPRDVAALGPFVVVHPGASVPARTWAPERFSALVGALARAGRAVVVTGGPGEAPLTAAVAGRRHPSERARRGVVDLGGRSSLPELAAVLAAARAVVTGNTGPGHLAAAVGTPVVSIFPPTVPAARWRPWGVPAAVLGDQGIACAGCRARKCPVRGHPCVGQLEPDGVVAVLDELCAGSGSGAASDAAWCAPTVGAAP